MTKLALFALAFTLPILPIHAASFDSAAEATNEIGLDLYRQIASGGENVCLSPYSIGCALAMTLTGADGETQTEMARVLHLNPQADSDRSFAVLQKSLAEIGPKTTAIAEQSKENGGPSEPIVIAVANRPNDYLAISEVFHKTFIALDEKGTEAAAATAVVMRELTAVREMTEPIEIRADRPFVYAIQHVPSGACLFIGRVTDPRS